ncbi:MAG: site-2 protease family protein [Turicibacter sp.]|nr:site-2 protease family protein [Turicibacter sp.]
MSRLIKFEPTFYVMTVLAILLGHFTQFVIFGMTLVVHELGHFFMARLFKWELEELRLFGFGGVMRFRGELNKSNLADLWVSLGGIMSNGLFLMLLLLVDTDALSSVILNRHYYLIFSQLFMIVFNLMPLPPLDGSRILMALLSMNLPYKKVLDLVNGFNVVLLGILVLLTLWFDWRQFLLIEGFLVYSTIKFRKESSYLFERFLLQKEFCRNTALPPKKISITEGNWENRLFRGHVNYFCTGLGDSDEICWLDIKYGQHREAQKFDK